MTFLNDCVGPKVEAACANPAPGEFLYKYIYIYTTNRLACKLDRLGINQLHNNYSVIIVGSEYN